MGRGLVRESCEMRDFERFVQVSRVRGRGAQRCARQDYGKVLLVLLFLCRRYDPSRRQPSGSKGDDGRMREVGQVEEVVQVSAPLRSCTTQ